MFKSLCLATCIGLAPTLVTAAAPAKAPDAKPPAKASDAKPSAPAPSTAAGGEGIYAYLTRDGAQTKVPLFSDDAPKIAVAQVADDVISLADLTSSIAAAHGSMAADASAGKKDFTPILERMIQVRLIVAEAREMGIDELPEVKEAIAAYGEQAGQDLLKARVAAPVKADPAEVEQNFRNAVREWKVKGVIFSGELDAKQHGPKLKAPGAFDAVAKQLAAEKKAHVDEEGHFLPRDKMLPQVIAVLEKLKLGDVSAPVKVGEGFAVLKVEAVRYPENATARAEAHKAALERKQKIALQKYYAELVKRYAKIDRALLKALDFHAKKPGLEALKKDTRVLAQIEGQKPITVGDLTATMVAGFFHGVDNAIKEKKVNVQKADVFDGMLSKRVIPLQVRADKIAETLEFKRRVAEYETGVLFSKFVEKAIVPKLDVGEAQLKKYHAEHKREFVYPTMYKLESLAFGKLGDAEAAVKKLRSGTDYKWLNANADGQIRPADRKLGIEGTLAATGMPKEVATALAGAKKGDYRLHAGPDSQFYAIHVIDVVGATEQPFEEVRETIAKTLFNDGVTSGVKKWAETLRKARPVKIFITRIGS